MKIPRERTNLDGRSEEYRKGYRSGYNVAMDKVKRQEEKEKRIKGNLHDISRLRVVEVGCWLHIEGDDDTYICPFCENPTYCEGDYVPKFCMECGADMRGGRE